MASREDRERKGRNAEEQFATAQRRIQRAKAEAATNLNLTGLTRLRKLPDEIGDLTGLQNLFLAQTRVSDLSPIGGLKSLQRLTLNYTKINDVVVVGDLARLTGLESLSLDNTQIKDLSPLSNHRHLRKLSIRNTNVEDFGPIAQMTSLQEAATNDLSPVTDGFEFEGCSGAKLSPFDHLVLLEQPMKTVETINEVRRQHGIPPHFPDGYEQPPFEVETEDEEESDSEQLAQRPASHSFAFRNGLIEAQAQILPPRHPDVAADIRNEVSEKTKQTSARLKIATLLHA